MKEAQKIGAIIFSRYRVITF